MSGGEAAAPVVHARPASASRFDPSALVFAAFGLFLALLVGLPLAWLAYYALTDAAGAPTLANLERLVTDETLRAPLQISLLVATCVGLLSAAVAAPIAWLAARTNMPGRGFVRVLVTASFVTPPFLGAIAWEILAAPNSGLLNQWYRWLYDLPPFVHLLDIYSVTGLIFVDTCYAFPFVFVLVANGLDRTPGDMEDASAILGAKPWRTAWRITLPLALPAVLAGMMVAFLRSLTLFGTPAILALPAQLPHHHDEDLEPVPVPAEPGARRRGLDPAARAHHPAAAGRALGARAAQLRRDRRARTARRGRSTSRPGAGRRSRSASSCCATRCSCPISRSCAPRCRRPSASR